MKMKNNYEKPDPILQRIDAIVRLLLLKEFTDDNKKFKLGEAVKFLTSCELEPNDIAKLVGKKKATEISTYLYPKKGIK